MVFLDSTRVSNLRYSPLFSVPGRRVIIGFAVRQGPVPITLGIGHRDAPYLIKKRPRSRVEDHLGSWILPSLY